MQMHRENLHENCDESDDADNEEQRTLFCANLDERVTEELLYEVFVQAGPIASTRIPKDHSGKQRTFGFITYVHKSTVPYAMQLYQGLSLYRKSLTIKAQFNPPQSPMRNYTSPGYGNKRSTYDNSSLRGSNYLPSNGSPPVNPFHKSFPDYSNSTKHQDNISKHPLSQKRHHTNTSPYQRNSGNSEDRYRDKDYNRRRQYNNDSNRNSEQRSGGRNRR